jgi:hypothetical protein
LLHACFAERQQTVPPVASSITFLHLMLPSVTQSSDFTMKKKITDKFQGPDLFMPANKIQ